jgi:histidinol-phosphate aminotransferase
MISALDFVRSHIKAMPGYQPILPYDVLSRELGLPLESLIKLDANENAYGLLPEVLASLADEDHAHIYPDPESRQVRDALAAYHCIASEQIVVSAGSDGLIDLIIRVFLEPDDGLLNCPPTFGMYAFDAVMNRSVVHAVSRKPDFSLDMTGIERTVAEKRPKLMFLANPNNPDGSLLSQAELRALLDLPLVLVLDEAYIQFAGEEYSSILQVARQENLIVLRTFSKWGGLAGIRVGYGVFPANLVPTLMKAKQPYNVSVLAQRAALACLGNVAKLDRQRDEIVTQRERLQTALKTIPWMQPYPSCANFILCRVVDRSAVAVKGSLRHQGILVRHFDQPGLEDHLRISIGREQDIDLLLSALKGMTE